MSGQHVSCERALVVDLSHASRVFLRVVWFSSLSKINTQVNIDSEKSLNGNDQLHAKKITIYLHAKIFTQLTQSS